MSWLRVRAPNGTNIQNEIDEADKEDEEENGWKANWRKRNDIETDDKSWKTR